MLIYVRPGIPKGDKRVIYDAGRKVMKDGDTVKIEHGEIAITSLGSQYLIVYVAKHPASGPGDVDSGRVDFHSQNDVNGFGTIDITEVYPGSTFNFFF